MIKTTLVFVLCGFVTYAQKSLTLEKDQYAQIRTKVDQLTLDSLVMKDSSMLIFNGHKTLYLQINHLVVAGKGCVLAGYGERGRNGDPPVNVPYNPRTSPYFTGERGWNGRNGTNLIITVKNLVLNDTLTIFVPGGNGGDGSVAPSLNVISARPGVGSNASGYTGRSGLGGNGGQGGDVMIVCPPSIAANLDHIFVVNYGGRAGTMGDLNPNSFIPFPFGPFDPWANANDFRYIRKITHDGMPGKVSVMRLHP